MRRTPISLLAVAAVATVFFAAFKDASAKSKSILWKGVDDALLLVNNNPVKEWGLFQTGNKRDPLLLQMGSRFLLIRVRDKQIFEVDRSRIQFKPDELWWDPAEHAAEPLGTSEWDAADIEAVFRIRVKITAEDRLLDIELPHQLDLSRSSPHPASRR